MNIINKFEEELYELENFEGSGFSSFLRDQSKKFIKKAASSAVEKAVNTGSTTAGKKFGTLIANKIIPPSSSSSSSKNKKNLNENSSCVIESKNNSTEIPIDSGYKIIKLIQKQNNQSITSQFNSI